MLLENTPTLSTPRLTLRKFTEADAPAFWQIMRDEAVNTYLPWFPVKSLGEAEAMLGERYLAEYDRPVAYRYAVCLADNLPVGYVCVGDGPSYDLGYGLKREFWHRGITTEAAVAVVSRVRAAGCPYITATHDVNNPRSGEVMKRLGMTYRYSYVEQWQPKDITVTFRMYQLTFDETDTTYMGYWERYPKHFVEE